MSYQLDCFDNIIGLSRTICECYDTGKPIDYSTSLSGLYLDELYPLTAYKGLLNCENGNDIWRLLTRSRDQAMLTFRSDANALMLRNHKLKRRVFKGKVGRLKYSTSEVITTGDWVGIRMVIDDVVSGKLKIKNIGTLFNETGSFDLYIYNNLNELEDIVTLNTIANTHNVNDITDITLDTHSDYVDNLEYFFIYQKNGLTPKSNLKTDSCYGVNRCKTDVCSTTQTNKQYGWSEWARIDGFKKTDVSDLSDLTCQTSDKMYGLTFDIEFNCAVEDIWCKDELDFKSDSIARQMALAIRFKAGELFFYDNLLSSNVNFQRLINGEAIQKAQEFFSQEYEKVMESIVENIDTTKTDCYECMDVIPMYKHTIWS